LNPVSFGCFCLIQIVQQLHTVIETLLTHWGLSYPQQDPICVGCDKIHNGADSAPIFSQPGLVESLQPLAVPGSYILCVIATQNYDYGVRIMFRHNFGEPGRPIEKIGAA
jgi:hypothetical protein